MPDAHSGSCDLSISALSDAGRVARPPGPGCCHCEEHGAHSRMVLRTAPQIVEAESRAMSAFGQSRATPPIWTRACSPCAALKWPRPQLMRHTPIACRRAVRSLPPPLPLHVCLSNNLDLALDRRVRPACPHQRRHGSHVPGPLEARRRATKRRMTISAAFQPQEQVWSPFNLLSLFGLRKTNTPPKWKYEPPTFSPMSGNIHLVPDVSSSSDTSVQDIASTLSAGLSIDQAETRAEPLALGDTLDNVSTETSASTPEACFEHFKLQVAHVASLSAMDRNRIIGKAFRSCSPANSASWKYNVLAVKYLLEMECNPKPLFRKISNFEIPPLYTTESRDLLECLQGTHWRFPNSRSHYLRLYTKLAEAASHANVSTGSLEDLEIMLLVRQLWQSARSQGFGTEKSTSQMLQALVSKIKDDKVNKSLRNMVANIDKEDDAIIRLVVCASSLANWLPTVERVLSCLPRERLLAYASSATLQLVQMIQKRSRFSQTVYKHRLGTWLDLLRRLDTKLALSPLKRKLFDSAVARVAQQVFPFNTPVNVGSDSLLSALLTKLSHEHTYQTLELERLFELIESISSEGWDEITSEKVVNSLVGLFSRMKQESLPYQDLLESFIVVTGQHAGLNVVLRLLTELDRQKLALRDFSIMDRLMAGKVSAIQQPMHQPSEAQRQRDAFALQKCRRIFEILSKISSPSITSSPIVTEKVLTTANTKRQIQHILDRAEADHALPLAFRTLTIDMSVQQRVDMIHQIAYYCSINNTRTQRENWRTMYYLYRHLREHSLPIGPTFTKAVVRISIIRPLIECRFVSARRLIWVCNLVARVEGKDAAKSIEHDFWLWRGDLLMHAKRVFVHAGGDTKAKAHIGTMKRLKLM